ncbi:hypothetical protein QVD17_20329 [Tagetes erecta]|uniref:Uncharacterized protein n=1 Tax=Tagetes erecta TaxID=13708 RepID=A0AAD8KLB1_TARER|nr:hypothetical protein QVD17_20329 [Tagetes erecta]
MKIHRVKRLASFLSNLISFFSWSRKYQRLLVLHIVAKITSEVNHNYVLLMFLALSLCIVTIFLRVSSKQSNDSEESHSHSNPLLSMLELYPLSHKLDHDEILDETHSLANIMAEDNQKVIPWLHKVDEEILDETHSLANIMAEDNQKVIPWLHKVDEEILDETYSLANIVAEEDEHEFIPRLVYLELIESATGNHDDYKNDDIPNHFVHVKLIEGATSIKDEIEEFHGYDGDNEGEGDHGSDDDDLNIRIEEFIAMNIRTWREEMLIDKLYAY